MRRRLLGFESLEQKELLTLIEWSVLIETDKNGTAVHEVTAENDEFKLVAGQDVQAFWDQELDKDVARVTDIDHFYVRADYEFAEEMIATTTGSHQFIYTAPSPGFPHRDYLFRDECGCNTSISLSLVKDPGKVRPETIVDLGTGLPFHPIREPASGEQTQSPRDTVIPPGTYVLLANVLSYVYASPDYGGGYGTGMAISSDAFVSIRFEPSQGERGTLASDFDGSGIVDFADFRVVADNFGRTDVSPDEGDGNRDGVVNFADFLLLSNEFGQRRE